jgi:ABC-type transport system involved in multi-copper enzyme maturation permease subunit
MSWNLIRQELFLNRRSWIIGGAVILLFNMMFAALADTYLKNAELLNAVKSMPPALLEGFGFHIQMMTSFEGWISSEPLTFFVLLLGAFAAIWAAAGIVKERDQQTDEFLFTLPYGRGTIFASKAAAHWIQITVVYVLGFAVVVWFGAMFSTVNSVKVLFLLMTKGYLVSLAFAGVGYVLTVLLSSERAALSLGIGIVLVSFLLNMLAGMDKSVAWLSKASLFTIFNTKDILTKSALSGGGIALTLLLYAAGLLTGLLVLKRQDI